ncbi:epimerase [Nocardioides sp. cx-169]|uniref:NAD-dependent epimerase/dehydratase family protein n=1 Tax=Nocardioides sp. cx-169 TaxID=2899080 RepID=UPI001E4CFD72|nr:NAD-dependent epimerase/dehydratase family protein [Nocardioides sp. cx-169]MCD4533290.1 epimerase [Nocardioides sp. cx-169]
MRILVLGGTVFLSKAIAAAATARGHEVVCAARGESGSLPAGARLVVWDRRQDAPAELTGAPYDAVVDVARQPSWVRRAVAALAGSHWVFVSTINVYADESTPGGRPGTLPLREPRHEDADLAADMDAYGPMKVACEQAVRDGVASSMVVRPGLIVGPDDPTGRFSYWPARLAHGGEVLAPGAPHDTVQVIDVRDLASWLVAAIEAGTTGDYDAVGPAQPLADALAAVAAGVGAAPQWTWVDQGFLAEQGVEPWAGPDAVPLWLPRPEYDGMLAHDVTPSLAAGLRPRPLAETAADTLAWLRSAPDAPVTGIDRDREAEVLAAWRTRTG